MGKYLNTKFGKAKINNNGYYIISSGKEGNHLKKLHRLIAAEYFGDWINDEEEFFHIHHIDGNKLNNCVLNLEPIPHGDHARVHRTGTNHSKETKLKMSKIDNTTSYFRVYKNKNPNYKQGFIYVYQYYGEDNKRKSIKSVDIKKLEEKVKSKGLEWIDYTKEE